MRKRNTFSEKLQLIPDSELKIVTSKANSLSAICRHFDLHKTGYNCKLLQSRLKTSNIDFAHIPTGYSTGHFVGKVSLNQLLTNPSVYNNKALKKRLLSENLLRNECGECQQEPLWRGRHLTLQLHHINGNRKDQRLENLILLCPNCHTQTFTHSLHKRYVTE